MRAAGDRVHVVRLAHARLARDDEALAAILKATPAENAAGEELALFSVPGKSFAYYFS